MNSVSKVTLIDSEIHCTGDPKENKFFRFGLDNLIIQNCKLSGNVINVEALTNMIIKEEEFKHVNLQVPDW